MSMQIPWLCFGEISLSRFEGCHRQRDHGPPPDVFFGGWGGSRGILLLLLGLVALSMYVSRRCVLLVLCCELQPQCQYLSIMAVNCIICAEVMTGSKFPSVGLIYCWLLLGSWCAWIQLGNKTVCQSSATCASNYVTRILLIISGIREVYFSILL